MIIMTLCIEMRIKSIGQSMYIFGNKYSDDVMNT